MPTRPKTHVQRQATQVPSSGTRREARGTSAERGYGYRWQRARAAFLSHHPLCLYCLRQGRTAVATLIDHATPHKGDMERFWDTAVWVPCCRPCHQYVTLAYDGGHGNAERERDGHYVKPLSGELC